MRKKMTATPKRLEIWKRETFDVWWLPYPYPDTKFNNYIDVNDSWSRETAKYCINCCQVYDQHKSHNAYVVTYYEELVSWGFKKGKCARCSKRKVSCAKAV